MSCSGWCYVQIALIIGLTAHAIAHQSAPLELQLEKEHVCFYKPFTLVCKHPDLSVRTEDERYYYATGTPDWEQNGQIITLDSIVYYVDYLNKTHTRLIVHPDDMIFSGSRSLSFTCRVHTIHHTAVRSNNVTVFPGLNRPLAPQLTTITPGYWTAAIAWTHNATCFEHVHCDFVVEWDHGNFNATTSSTTFLIDRLKPGKRQKVAVRAQCTIATPSPQLLVSSNGTREFRTKDGPVALSLTSASNTSIACVGKTFTLKCSHPSLNVLAPSGAYVFASALPTWKIDGEILTPDGSLFKASYPSESESVLEVSFNKFPTFRYQNQIFNFSCAIRAKSGTVFNSENVSVHPFEFPLQVHLSSGHTNFTINWKEYSICTTTLHFHIIWVPVIAGSGQEEWNMKNQAYTRGTNYTISDLNSTYSYKVIVNVRQVPGAGNDINAIFGKRRLNLTTSQTTPCLNTYYFLFCTSPEPFGSRCDSSTANWFHNGKRLSASDTNYTISEQGTMERVLKIFVTVDEFREQQTFQCKSGLHCESSVVTVGKYGVPFSPAIVNYTVGTTWIILEWTHNQSCCTNGSYSLSWEPLQSKESFPDRNKTDNPSQRHNITQLRAGTTYVIILVAKCPGYHVMNDTQIVITFNDTSDVPPTGTISPTTTIATPTPSIRPNDPSATLKLGGDVIAAIVVVASLFLIVITVVPGGAICCCCYRYRKSCTCWRKNTHNDASGETLMNPVDYNLTPNLPREDEEHSKAEGN